VGSSPGRGGASTMTTAPSFRGTTVQQPGIAGPRGRELPDTEQPADGVQRHADVHVGVGVHPAGDGAFLNEVTAIPS